MKTILILISAILFAGCSSESFFPGDIQLKNNLNFNGSVVLGVNPEFSIDMKTGEVTKSFVYKFSQANCYERYNKEIVTISKEINYDKNLNPFNYKKYISDYCIETHNGKTKVFLGDELKEKYSKQEIIPIFEKLVLEINKMKEVEDVRKTIKNLDSYKE